MGIGPFDSIAKQEAHYIETMLEDKNRRSHAQQELESYLQQLSPDQRAREAGIVLGTIANETKNMVDENGRPLFGDLLLFDPTLQGQFDANAQGVTKSSLQSADAGTIGLAGVAENQFLLDNFEVFHAQEGVNGDSLLFNNAAFKSFIQSYAPSFSVSLNTDGGIASLKTGWGDQLAFRDREFQAGGENFSIDPNGHFNYILADGSSLPIEDLSGDESAVSFTIKLPGGALNRNIDGSWSYTDTSDGTTVTVHGLTIKDGVLAFFGQDGSAITVQGNRIERQTKSGLDYSYDEQTKTHSAMIPGSGTLTWKDGDQAKIYTDTNGSPAPVQNVQFDDVGVTFVRNNLIERHNADGTIIIKDSLGRVTSETDNKGVVITFGYYQNEKQPYTYTTNGQTWTVDHNFWSGTDWNKWHNGNDTQLSFTLNQDTGSYTTVDGNNLSSSRYLDGHSTKTLASGATEIRNRDGNLTAVETTSQIFEYSNGSICRIDNKQDGSYWSFDKDGWYLYDSDGIKSPTAPRDLINNDKAAFESNLEPALNAQDKSNRITFHADGSSGQTYVNGENLTFNSNGDLVTTQLPSGQAFTKQGGSWGDSTITSISATYDGDITIDRTDFVGLRTANTFHFSSDGSFSVDNSMMVDTGGVITSHTATAKCAKDGTIQYVKLPDGSYVNHYPGETPAWQREDKPNVLSRSVTSHATGATKLPGQFDGNFSLTSTGNLMIDSENFDASHALFFRQGPMNNAEEWSIPISVDQSERHNNGGIWAVTDDYDTASSLHYGGIDIIGLNQGQIDSNTSIILPDGSKIACSDGTWIHTVGSVKEEVAAPSLDSLNKLNYVTPVQGGYMMTNLDGTSAFYLPDKTKILQHDDGQWYTDDGKLYANLLTVSPAGQIMVGTFGNTDDGHPTVAVRVFGTDSWSSPVTSNLDFDQSAAGQALLASTISAIQKDPSLLLSELKTLTVADQFVLNQRFDYRLNDLAEGLGGSDAEAAVALLNKTSDSTDYVGQMHLAIQELDTNPQQAERDLLALAFHCKKADLDTMRQEFTQLYGIDPFQSLANNTKLPDQIRSLMSILEKGADGLISKTDETGKTYLDDADFCLLSHIALKYKDIDLFSTAFQLSSGQQRSDFATSADSNLVSQSFSGSDEKLAQDWVKYGYVGMDTLLNLNSRVFFIDYSSITSSFDNAPEDQKIQYRQGLKIASVDHPQWLNLTGDDRANAVNSANLSSADKAAVDYYFSVHDAMLRASWNENQIVNFGYSASPTDTAKYEDRFLHGRDTVISNCMDELKVYFLGIGGGHYDYNAVVKLLQNMSADDLAMLKNDPTFKPELENALRSLLNPNDYTSACTVIESLISPVVLTADASISATAVPVQSKLDALLSTTDPATTVNDVLAFQISDIRQYADASSGYKAKVDAQIANLSEPAKSLVQSLLSEIGQTPADSFKFIIDPYQQFLIDEVTKASDATTLIDIQNFLSKTPNQCPSFLALNSMLSNADKNLSYRQLVQNLEFHTPEDYASYRSAHLDDPDWPRQEAIWNLRSTIGNFIQAQVGRAWTSESTGFLQGESSSAAYQLFNTGRLSVDFLVGDKTPKSQIFQLLLNTDANDNSQLLSDSMSKVSSLLTPEEREVFGHAIQRQVSDGATSTASSLDTEESLRLYAIGDLGSVDDALNYLNSLKVTDGAQEKALALYSSSFHDQADPSKPPADFYLDLLSHFPGNTEKIFEALMAAPAEERAKFLDPAFAAALSTHLSPEEIEVLTHALNRVKDDPTTSTRLDNVELLRLYALGDMSGSVVDFLNGLKTDIHPGGKVEAIMAYSVVFHDGGNKNNANANLLSDLIGRFGNNQQDLINQITSACSLKPEDLMQIFFDTNYEAYAKETGWSAYALRNGAREAMVQAQQQSFSDFSRAVVSGHLDDPALQADLQHLQNSMAAYTEAKAAFTQNVISAAEIALTVPLMILAPELSLAAKALIAFAGAALQVGGTATGMGSDYVATPGQIAGDATKGFANFALMVFGPKVAEWLSRLMIPQLTEGLLDDFVMPKVLKAIPDFLGRSLTTSDEELVAQSMRNAFLANGDVLPNELPTLIQAYQAGADQATIDGIAQKIARDLVLPAATQPGVMSGGQAAFQQAMIDAIASGLKEAVGNAAGNVGLAARMAANIAAFEATGILFNAAAAGAARVFADIGTGKTLGQVLREASADAKDSIAPTAASIFVFTAGSTALCVLWNQAAQAPNTGNTSAISTSNGGFEARNTSQQPILVDTGDGAPKLLGPGDAIAVEDPNLFRIVGIPDISIQVLVPADQVATSPQINSGGSNFFDQAVRAEQLSQALNEINASTTDSQNTNPGGNPANTDQPGTTADGKTNDTSSTSTDGSGSKGDAPPAADTTNPPEKPLPFEDAKGPDKPTLAQRWQRLGCIGRSCVTCLTGCLVGCAGTVVVGGVLVVAGVLSLKQFTDKLKVEAPTLFLSPPLPAADATILKGLTADVLKGLPNQHTYTDSNGITVPCLTRDDVINMPKSDDALATELGNHFYDIAIHEDGPNGGQFVITEAALQNFLALHNKDVAGK